MNLVGHVAVAPDPSAAGFLAGCVLPDVAAIARVRVARPTTDPIAAGVAFHHECDHVFHSLAWFNDTCVQLRDDLLAAGVDRGPARATAHAGLEMLLDGALVGDADVRGNVRIALDTLDAHAAALAPLVAGDAQERWIVGVSRIASSLDVDGYTDAVSITMRLQRMTAGRARIELRAEQAPAVTQVLETAQRRVVADAPLVLEAVRSGVRVSR
ncbi:MAG: hypothetical protein U0W40_10680 [Acidimicrobiia bacterium]